MEQSHGSIGHGQVDNANGLVATIPIKDRAHPDGASPSTVTLDVYRIQYNSLYRKVISIIGIKSDLTEGGTKVPTFVYSTKRKFAK